MLDRDWLDGLIEKIPYSQGGLGFWERIGAERLRDAILAASETPSALAPESVNRVIVRPDDCGLVDDVVIENVTMFRMERMDKNAWWLACYFGDDGDRICFWSHYNRAEGVTFHVNEEPFTRTIVNDSRRGAALDDKGER